MAINNIQHPIDAVILWVDGNDKNHQEKMSQYLEKTVNINSTKIRTRYDQVNEIKFTVDSILKYASYIRNIYIITDNQTPDFLKLNTTNLYKSVTIIDHKTIFNGYEEFLPTFNSISIETLMFRIPKLAEHFIYLNDDFFLINKTEPTDFFKEGFPVLRGKWINLDKNIFYKKFIKPRNGHKAAQQRAAQMVGFNKYYNFKHTPHPFRKSTFETYLKNNERVFVKNIDYKFRSNDQFLLQSLINHLEIKNKTCILKKNLQLKYFRSYKKPLLWYKFKLNLEHPKKLFLGLQSLDRCPQNKLDYIIEWLENRIG
ncbi:Stealth CR1 domain-containing protein [Formosa sp. L2A11]|uniref:Stealth CR1 domain-containing protein n=1 Tax=Formosa sp. L2A11 TaxID=2686363 RepID=UPI001E5F4C92|nr:Stealth CR1 domain-containing protein [Formosa sp. L2A11]